MRWSPQIITGAFVVGACARVVASWSQLPPVMAAHFDAAGTPDGFMARGPFFAVLALACGLAVLIPALGPLVLRHAPDGAFNLPHRDYWLALERRAETVGRLERCLAWLSVPIAALFALLVELVIDANVHSTALNAHALWAGVALVAASLGFLIVRLYRQFARPPRATGSPASP